MKMQVCTDCGFIQENSVNCSACDSKALKIEEVHDNQLLHQEQMLNSYVDEEMPLLPSKFENADKLDFMGVEMKKEAFPILFDWALTNVWSLQNEVQTILETDFKNDQSKLTQVIWDLEDKIGSMLAPEKEKYFKERI